MNTTPAAQLVGIRAAHYGEAVAVLVADPIVQAMAAEIPDGADLVADGMVHDTGSPTFNMMMRANQGYAERGGKNHAHIGAVAEAIIEIHGAR